MDAKEAARQADLATATAREADARARDNAAGIAKLGDQLQIMAKEIKVLMEELRQLELQKRKSDMLLGSLMQGDISGPVVGKWSKLNEDGTGTITYNDKEYITAPLKQYSTKKGKSVEMLYEKGVYYSQM